MWPYLDDIPTFSIIPCLAGDFNVVVSTSEKPGGHPTTCSTGFSSWITRNALADLGFTGPSFTWRRGFLASTTVWKRLDCGLSTINWRHTFSDAYIRHLPRLHSDHCPLLIQLYSSHRHESHLKPLYSKLCGYCMMSFTLMSIILGKQLLLNLCRNWTVSSTLYWHGTYNFLGTYFNESADLWLASLTFIESSHDVTNLFLLHWKLHRYRSIINSMTKRRHSGFRNPALTG